MAKKVRFWMGTKGPFFFFSGKEGFSNPFRVEESDVGGTFSGSRRGTNARQVALESSETQTDVGQEQIASQSEIGNGPYQNYLASHRWVPSTQSVTPV